MSLVYPTYIVLQIIIPYLPRGSNARATVPPTCAAGLSHTVRLGKSITRTACSELCTSKIPSPAWLKTAAEPATCIAFGIRHLAEVVFEYEQVPCLTIATAPSCLPRPCSASCKTTGCRQKYIIEIYRPVNNTFELATLLASTAGYSDSLWLDKLVYGRSRCYARLASQNTIRLSF